MFNGGLDKIRHVLLKYNGIYDYYGPTDTESDYLSNTDKISYERSVNVHMTILI
jgi:hypothetical protein